MAWTDEILMMPNQAYGVMGQYNRAKVGNCFQSLKLLWGRALSSWITNVSSILVMPHMPTTSITGNAQHLLTKSSRTSCRFLMCRFAWINSSGRCNMSDDGDRTVQMRPTTQLHFSIFWSFNYFPPAFNRAPIDCLTFLHSTKMVVNFPTVFFSPPPETH